MKIAWQMSLTILLMLNLNITRAFGDVGQVIDIRLMGTDLIDDMFYDFYNKPPFAEQTSLVLSRVSAPVGLSKGFEDFVENRLWQLAQEHPKTNINFIYCQLCSQWIVSSNAKSTIMEKGLDSPTLLKEFPTHTLPQYALSLVFEAEESDLVLLAQIYQVKPPQQIIWAKKYRTSRYSPLALQKKYPLLSLEKAQEQNLRLIYKQEPLQWVTRFNLRSFNNNNEMPPMFFVEQSLETTQIPHNNSKLGFTVGFSSIKSLMEAWSVGGHYARLLMNKRPTLSMPDLYFIAGASYIRLKGPAALPFATGVDALEIYKEPRASIVSYRWGLEAHVKHRYGLLVFAEFFQSHKDSDRLKKENIGLPYHLIGTGMVVKW